ncbi:hypothetical protein B0H19DRAFT_1073141 [Mycena capillaripes]|nr:hypothetical protein B0H19DRAFT_1073141 [Mycena capillaripes]
MASSITTEKLSLHDLVEDVVLLILGECDIAGVIAVSETSKLLHHLAFERNVWFSLVSKLVQRRFIDSQPDNGYLKDLSTEQLIDLVKKLLHGPKAWADIHPAPVESRRIVLHPKITTGPGILFWETRNKAKLLPGGKYVLFLNRERLELWSVFEYRLVWKHTPNMDQASVLEFEAELVEDDRAVILTCQRTRADPRKHFVEISILDLKSGVSTLKLVSRAPDSEADNPYTGCTLCGDVVAVYLYRARQLLLVNWRTSSRVVLRLTTDGADGFSHDCRVAIVPDHLVLTLPDNSRPYKDKPRPHQLALCPFGSFKSWEPTDSEKEPSLHVAVADLPIRSAHIIPLAGSPSQNQSLWVFESPLQRGRFKVWVHSVVYDEDETHKLLSNCEFTSHGTGVSWRLVSSIPMPKNIDPTWMALSGHTLGWRYPMAGQAIFPPAPLAHEDIKPLQFSGRGYDIHLSSFSGALTYSTSEELVIVYYD